ncbi:hypothetical protein FGO68_gene11633 [Halteria grandinella]|uniref:Uncharacterized protein n=1 Tax=Halteria grandinella TaxID=5974 RepID=A0A8J8NGA7_HALGN|nr:hypothetical protein FGO68_gene11633 [Halteria grandinella]
MGKGHQIPRCANRASPGYPGDAATVEELYESMHHIEGYSTEAFSERVDSQCHYPSAGIDRKELTDTCGVGADQIVLEVSQFLGGNLHVREAAKSCVNAVNGFIFL